MLKDAGLKEVDGSSDVRDPQITKGWRPPLARQPAGAASAFAYSNEAQRSGLAAYANDAFSP